MAPSKRKKLDSFHEAIRTCELRRLGSRGCFNGLLTGGVIGFLPILNYGSPTMKFAIILEVLQPRKVICLSITEDFSLSDVSGFQTSAEMVMSIRRPSHENIVY
ncbi:hypothetical protein M408DRAFT_306429 [Serendipita vermifera MAFF 305830]|uniref:Uncharacterized protein n=1 Tax=Serendipita vermifera MAFF 305830 TaxID=933852 RepID=A0A0C2W2N9_SERVB|nr:hypothetical protein M408DRAFT_306429 [Serendipita vermifera MAFF 305830]